MVVTAYYFGVLLIFCPSMPTMIAPPLWLGAKRSACIPSC